MLNIVIPSVELWDEKNEQFIYTKERKLQLEHSLVSVAKWEAKWNKPFINKNDTTPEIIMTNGSMAVFYLEDYAGWNCKAGDILTFSFEKYESDAVSNQVLVIGYIKDGVMYDGESFGSLSGSYELKVREGGEYNLYITSATSDYLTLKQGTINLSK